MLLMKRLKYALGLVSLAGLMLAVSPSAYAANACDVIQREGSRLLASGTPSRSKVSRLVGRHVATSSWAKSALGPSYNKLSSSQRSKYKSKFKSYLISRATSFAKRYPGSKLQVIRKNCSGSGRINSTYYRRSGGTTNISWRVSQSKGRVWISDVSVGGVSLRSNVGGPLRQAYRSGGFSALMRKLN